MAKLDAEGNLLKDGNVTPDGYAVNTVQSSFMPHSSKITDQTRLLPPQIMPNIGDRLSEKGIDWAWYSGGWNQAVAGHPDHLFQFHHQPLAYFANYGDDTPGRAAHLKDEADFLEAIQNNALPPVVFYKPSGEFDEHPGIDDIVSGDNHLADLIAKIQASPAWADTAVIVTYDENGGAWDHVAPPKIDRWGPGTRIPAIIISPYAKRGFVDHTVYDTTSILRLIELRFGLAPLTTRDAAAAPLLNAFDFPQTGVR